VGDLLTYLYEPREWVDKFVAIAYNAKAFVFHFILNGAILFKWQPVLIMNGKKIMCTRMEHLVFPDSVSFLPSVLRNLPEAFGYTASKSWCPHYFNTSGNKYYVGKMSDISFHGADAIREGVRKEFWNSIMVKSL
jgi:hypothetical protein